MPSFQKFPIGSGRVNGYKSDKVNCPPDYISSPSQNVLVNESGKVESRLGYTKEFNIGVTGKSARPFYHSSYKIAFFALGTKVYYRNFTTLETFDTGITLTEGTVTRFDEILGDVYFSNTTDGIYRIMVSRVNGAVTTGDPTITLDASGAARLSAFGDTSGDIRIDGVDEAYASLDIATGILTLTGTASQGYADNAVAIFIDRYASLVDASKILFFKARMHLMGFPNTTNADAPKNSVITGQFIINNIQEIEKIVDFTFGTGGSTRITVSGGGEVTNILGVSDHIYFFTQGRVFATAASSILTAGTTIGFTIPDEKDNLHGCLNEDSATVMGNSSLTYITNDKRFMEIPIDTESGAALASPQEDYDVDIREILKDMDDTQENAFVYHYRGGRQTIYQIKVKGQYIWMIRDHNIIRPMGSGFVRGAWQPPQYIVPVSALFEDSNGVLYGTDSSNDAVYSFFTSFTDDQSGFEQIIATGEFNVGDAMVIEAQLQGEVNQPSKINMLCYVTNETSGRRSGSPKIIDGANYSYADDNSVGAVMVGGGQGGETTLIAKWKRSFGVFPSQATRAQLIIKNDEEGGYMSVSAYQLDGTQSPNSFSKNL